MKKKEFLEELEKRLAGLSKEAIEERVSFYEEAIDDRMAEGEKEEDAVAEMGNLDEIVNEIAGKISIVQVVKDKFKPKRKLEGWEIALLILGFPVWFPLVMTLFVLLLTAYVLVWTGVIVTCATEASLLAVGVAGFASYFIAMADGAAHVGYIGFGLLGIGGAILLYYGCKAVIKVTFRLTKFILLSIKKAFIRGGNRNA